MSNSIEKFAFRFEYSDDGVTFEIYEDGRVLIIHNGCAPQPLSSGAIINHIPRLIAKAREDAYANADCEPR